MIKNIIVISCILFASLEVSIGQNSNDTNLINEFDKHYTPPKGSILGSKLSNNESSRDYQINNQYLIHFNASKLLKGYVTFAIEYYLKEEFSVQARFNKSFMIDFVQELTFVIKSDLQGNLMIYNKNNGVIDQYDILEHDRRKSLSTYALGSSFRYYKTIENDNNKFYEFGVDYYNTKFSISSPYRSNNSNFLFIGDGKIKQTHYFFNWGTQYKSDIMVNLTHEIYLGVGVKFIKYNIYDGKTYNEIDYSLKTGAFERSMTSTFQLGYILSFGL